MSIHDEILFSSIGELRRRMDAGEFGPLALTKELLARIERSQNSLNSFITVTGEIALQEAEAAEEALRAGQAKGPLHGIPFAYKDLLATAGTSRTDLENDDHTAAGHLAAEGPVGTHSIETA